MDNDPASQEHADPAGREHSDPVIKEYKVFVSTQLSKYLHLVQAPSRTRLPANNGCAIAGRYKKVSRAFELNVPMDTSHPTYSKGRGEDLAAATQTGSIKLAGSQLGVASGQKLDRIQLVGGPVAKLNAKYFAAVFHEDALHLTPLPSVIQLRPSLTYLDDIDAKTKASTKKMADMDKAAQPDSVKAVQVHFRKKETEEQLAARLNSYSFLKRQIDEEDWTSIFHFSHESEEAEKVAERLISEKVEPVDYLELDPRRYVNSFFL